MSKRYPGGIIRKTPQTPSQTSAQGVWDMASVTQAVKENTWPIAGVPDPISKSLRFRSSASAYLNRTPASAGNRKTWTWSGWVKRGTLGQFQVIEAAVISSGATEEQFVFNASDQLSYRDGVTGDYTVTSAVFRDPSAWYHVVYRYDSSNATQANRGIFYVNGVQQTASVNAIPLNRDSYFNLNVAHAIGRFASIASYYFDGYLAEINFIDGQALTPSSFGNTNDQTGVWQPIAYTGTYGTNGFYLPFSNTASTATLGYDFSGNSNNWTPNNISLTSGSTYDSMVDVPTQWIPYNTAGDTGALYRGNYCTLNPLDTNSNLALSNGNLTAIPSSTADYWLSRATMQLPSTGKWYWELTLNNTPYLYQAGIYSANRPNSGGTSATGNEYQVAWGTAWTYIMYQSNNAAFAAWGTNTNPTSGDVLMFAVDSDNGTMWVGRNGTWYNTSGTANPATNTDPRFSSIPSGLFAGVNLPNPASGGVSMNFGQRPFSYTPPAGFKTLCTTNLSTPTIGATASTQAGKYFGINLWTGNGSTGSRAITGLGFKPDWVWWKNRTTAKWHQVFDSNRGADKALSTNATDAEDASGGYGGEGSVTSFDTDGYTLQGGVGNNENGSAIVGWAWQAGQGTNATNTAGSITSTVSANTTAGFSIVTYTGNGTQPSTVGHGLGVAPKMIFVKSRSNGGTYYDWAVYNSDIGAGNAMLLNSTSGSFSKPSYWNSTTATSTVFTLGSDITVNQSSATYVAYCFAQVAGYSAFGSYTGNGSSDGVFVYLGFRARYVMIKCSSSTGGWVLLDTARDPYNDVDNYLYANSSAADAGSSNVLDINSNGFKIRNSWTDINGSGTTYIYMAFAESPFKFALAR